MALVELLCPLFRPRCVCLTLEGLFPSKLVLLISRVYNAVQKLANGKALLP